MSGSLAGVHVNLAARMSLFRKGAIVAVCRAVGIPVVLHLHADMQDFYIALPAFLQRMTRWVFRHGHQRGGDRPRGPVFRDRGASGARPSASPS